VLYKKKIPALMKKLKSGDTFEINHRNQFKCSDTAHRSFQKILQMGREIITLMFSVIVISSEAFHLDLYIASVSSSLMEYAADKRIEFVS